MVNFHKILLLLPELLLYKRNAIAIRRAVKDVTLSCLETE